MSRRVSNLHAASTESIAKNVFGLRMRHIVAAQMMVWTTIFLVSIACACMAQGQTEAAGSVIQARKASDFVDSMGVNVHMEQNKTLPYKKYNVVNDALRDLGMGHIRDEINHADPFEPFYDKRFVEEMNRIGGLGYRLCGLIEGGGDYPPGGHRLEAGHVGPMIAQLPLIDAIEGPNEPDGGGFVYDGVGYPRGAINESRDLWNIVKTNPDTRQLPVLVMSEASAPDYKRLARVTPPPIDYANLGNMHAYQGGQVGDGTGESSLRHWYIRFSRDLTDKKPLWTTEMGYHNDTNYLSDGEQQGVSQRASAIYLPIAFLSGFNNNVVRTFSYELVDEAASPPLTTCSATNQLRCSGNGYYGLLNYDFSPKPAYAALQNLIRLLRDSDADFDPGSLEITFSGIPGTMRYTLLEKSNGDYYLALWNDVSVYRIAECIASKNNACTDVRQGKDVYPENVPITVTLREARSFTVYAPNDDSGVSPTRAYTIESSDRAIKLELAPKVLLVKIANGRG